jgi:hypothetical protein
VGEHAGTASGERGDAFDQPVAESLLTDALQERGVVATWTELVIPVLVGPPTPDTARLSARNALPRRRPPTPIVVGGPGWRSMTVPSPVVRAESLAEAVAAVTHGL